MADRRHTLIAGPVALLVVHGARPRRGRRRGRGGAAAVARGSPRCVADSGVDAHARFATRRELRPLLIREPVPGRFVFGSWNGRLLATENRRWAPNRQHRRSQGVGAGDRRAARAVSRATSPRSRSAGRPGAARRSQCAEPGLLDWAGPAIVLSVKRDLMDTTIARRRDLGDVRVFDPGGFLGSPVAATSRSMPTRSAGGRRCGWRTPRPARRRPARRCRRGHPRPVSKAAWTSGRRRASCCSPACSVRRRCRTAPSMHEVAKWVFDMDDAGPDERRHAECKTTRDASIGAVQRRAHGGRRPRTRSVIWQRSGTSPTTEDRRVRCTRPRRRCAIRGSTRTSSRRPTSTARASGSTSTG